MANCLKIKEAAKLLNCGVSTVYELFHDGKLEGFRLGKRGVRLLEESVEEYISRKDTKSKGIIVRGKSARRAKGGERKIRVITRTGPKRS